MTVPVTEELLHFTNKIIQRKDRYNYCCTFKM